MPGKAIKTIVIVDSDKEFYSKLSSKFFNDLNIMPMEFSDVKYFLQSKSNKLNNIDILMISEDFISSIKKPDIASYVFVLTKTEKDMKRSDNFYNLYKYRNLIDIFNDVLRVCDINQGTALASKVITFYSPLGNCGKTSLALSAGQIMASQYSKVLYISMETLCSMYAFMPDIKASDNDLDALIRSHSEEAWSKIRSNIQVNGNFSYLKPFNEVGSILDLTVQDYGFLIRLIRKKNEFKRIIVDMPSEFNYKLTEILGQSDKVVIVCRQDDYSVERLKQFTSVIPPDDKFIFICNKMDKNKPDNLKASSLLSGQNVLENIPLLDIVKRGDALPMMMANRSVKGLAATLM